jgi:hypothetical protein
MIGFSELLFLFFISWTLWQSEWWIIAKYSNRSLREECPVGAKEEPAHLNRDVALRVLWSNSLFSKVVFSSFLSQNNQATCLGRILSKLIPSYTKRKVLDISSVFRMKYLQDAGIDNVNRGKVTWIMAGQSAHSAVYHQARPHCSAPHGLPLGSGTVQPRWLVHLKLIWYSGWYKADLKSLALFQLSSCVFSQIRVYTFSPAVNCLKESYWHVSRYIPASDPYH